MQFFSGLYAANNCKLKLALHSALFYWVTGLPLVMVKEFSLCNFFRDVRGDQLQADSLSYMVHYFFGLCVAIQQVDACV